VLEALGRSGLQMTVDGRSMSVAEALPVIGAFGLAMNLLAMWLVSIQDREAGAVE
jgi:hypothetical protein